MLADDCYFNTVCGRSDSKDTTNAVYDAQKANVSRRDPLKTSLQSTSTAVGYVSIVVPLKPLLNKQHKINKFQAMVIFSRK